jgi:hypoxanthine phosphoribosyltransferase
MGKNDLAEIERIRRDAELLYDEQAITNAVRDMAGRITDQLAGTDPLVVCVLNGGLMLTGWLTARLDFPLQLDYAHATRYRGATQGGALKWIARPQTSLEGRTLLLVDDIFDEGLTLASLVEACRELGAREVRTAVLVRKLHDRATKRLTPDFVGLTVPDRYVFGCGMDYKHYLRNLPAIYAVRD